MCTPALICARAVCAVWVCVSCPGYLFSIEARRGNDSVTPPCDDSVTTKDYRKIYLSGRRATV